MAGIAGNLLVPTQQPVIRVDVVVKNRLFPSRTRMTGIALLAATGFVRVVLEVARDAGTVHRVLERILGVAVPAVRIRMLAFQREIRVAGVIET